ncbi:MAG: Fic family protein [Woeseiaceae bacterium]|nr:Fic family protein [Woeseiaceae bacterium]
MSPKYEARGPEAEFEPGSRGRVLRNLLGITRVRDMNEAESQALELAQEAALDQFAQDHRFTTDDIRTLHRLWLGAIYPWAGDYRNVNIDKGGFQFAHAPLIAGLMEELERGALRRNTPCRAGSDTAVARALAEVHAELILVHPFREGNGRLARLLALLMALQAGLPPLDFGPLSGRGKHLYIGAIHAAVGRDYEPLSGMFARVIERTRRRAASNWQ